MAFNTHIFIMKYKTKKIFVQNTKIHWWKWWWPELLIKACWSGGLYWLQLRERTPITVELKGKNAVNTGDKFTGDGSLLPHDNGKSDRPKSLPKLCGVCYYYHRIHHVLLAIKTILNKLNKHAKQVLHHIVWPPAIPISAIKKPSGCKEMGARSVCSTWGWLVT